MATILSTSNSTFNFSKLNGASNYSTWATNAMYMLIDKDLWEVTEGTEVCPLRYSDDDSTATASQKAEREKEIVEWNKKNNKARAAIVLSVTDGPKGYIQSESTAKGMWDKLKKLYEEQGYNARYLALTSLISTRYEDMKSIEEYTEHIKQTARRLADMGSKLDEWIVTSVLLANLGPTYETYVTLKRQSARTKDPELDEVIAELIDESRVNDTKDSTAMSLRKDQKGGTYKFKGICNYCKKPGHKQADCYALHPEKRPKRIPSKSGSNDVDGNKKEGASHAFFTLSVSADGHADHRDQWYIDTGATDHICTSRNAFKEYTACKRRVYSATGFVEAQGIGSVDLDTALPDGSHSIVHLKDVLHVPSLFANLISGSRMTRGKVTFDNTTFLMQQNGITLGYAPLDGGLFSLRLANRTFAASVTAPPSIETWHRRLGHLNYASVKHLAQMSNGMDLTGQEEQGLCKPCSLSKLQRAYTRTPSQRAEGVFELIHSDLVGPITPTGYDGARYYVTFTDDYTRLTRVFTLKEKSQLMSKLKEFYAWCFAQRGVKIKRIRSDNGTEFKNGPLKQWMVEVGIQWEPTVTYSPEQNGSAERNQRTLNERARAMIADSGLDKTLWPELIMTANYLRNRSPTKILGLTPYEAYEGTKPSLEHLRIIGSTVYTLIPKERRLQSAKFDDRSQKCRLVGYDGESIYRVWNPVTHRVTRVKDVLFDEGSQTGPKMDQAESKTTPEEGHKVDQVVLETDETAQGPLKQPEQRRPGSSPQDYEHDDEDVGDTIVVRPPQSQGSTERAGQTAREPATVVEPRRSGRPTRLPQRYALSAVSTTYDICEPETYAQAVQGPDQAAWKEAMDEEMRSLQQNGTWSLVDLPPDRRALRGKWVYKLKRGPQGEIIRHKARWVVKGYEQEHGIDYDETFAAVVKPAAFRPIFALAAKHDLEIEQMDVKTAFLHGKIEETIYVEQPTGYEQQGKVCLLRKGLYGLKQAPRMWYKTLHDFLVESGFHRTQADHSVFVTDAGINGLIVTVYVDDLKIIGRDKQAIQRLKNALSERFDMTDLGPISYYLGMSVRRDRAARTITLSQAGYLQKVLHKFGFDEAKPAATPMESGICLEKETIQMAEAETVQRYQAAIGSLMYAMTISRPDIAFAVSTVSQFAQNPNDSHWKAVKRVFRYLRGTLDQGITFGKSDDGLIGYSDADWAGDRTTRKSTSGYIFMMYGGPVSWSSKRQTTVALSTCEAEYIAMTQAAKEATWLRILLTELGVSKTGPVKIFVDNQGAIALAKNPEFHTRTKHIDIQYHYVRQEVENERIQLGFTDTGSMLADCLTKPLPRIKLERFMNGISMEGTKLS
jgi:transposase InsO family protein